MFVILRFEGIPYYVCGYNREEELAIQLPTGEVLCPTQWDDRNIPLQFKRISYLDISDFIIIKARPLQGEYH